MGAGSKLYQIFTVDPFGASPRCAGVQVGKGKVVDRPLQGGLDPLLPVVQNGVQRFDLTRLSQIGEAL